MNAETDASPIKVRVVHLVVIEVTAPSEVATVPATLVEALAKLVEALKSR